MFNIFKKTSKTSTITLNKELVERIYKVIYIPNLIEILFSPESKICILNTYNDSFDSFLNYILSKSDKKLIAININAYFSNREDIVIKFKRLIPILESNTITSQTEYELTEILNTIDYLTARRG